MLVHSPIIRAIANVAEYIERHGEIGLTATGALNRKFVSWAATKFNWPYYTANELYRVNKVLNEDDFPPLGLIHELLIELKIVRCFKKGLRLTKGGSDLVRRPGKLIGVITPFFLFHIDHTWIERRPMPLPGNWETYLSIINVEAEAYISGSDLAQILIADSEAEDDLDCIGVSFYHQILRPLCWAGLMVEHRTAPHSFGDALFKKTQLWGAVLRLDTDGMVQGVKLH